MKKKNKEHQNIGHLSNIAKALIVIAIVLLLAVLFFVYLSPLGEAPTLTNQEEGHARQKESSERINQQEVDVLLKEEPEIIDGKDVETGLLAGDGLRIVKGTCTACHSSKLIIQNRKSREEWHQSIVWMQETQGLWDLGENESIILDYLEKNYGPQHIGGRRPPLGKIQWYELED